MLPRIQAVILPSETTDFRDDLRRIFLELGQGSAASLTGEYSPPLDVHETDGFLEITVDLPAVDARAMRILAKGDTILVAGLKAPRRSQGDASFHLVERGYGRFARAVRLTTPCDVASARATFAHGELRIALPKIAERRGRPVPIAITDPAPNA